MLQKIAVKTHQHSSSSIILYIYLQRFFMFRTEKIMSHYLNYCVNSCILISLLKGYYAGAIFIVPRHMQKEVGDRPDIQCCELPGGARADAFEFRYRMLNF